MATKEKITAAQLISKSIWHLKRNENDYSDDYPNMFYCMGSMLANGNNDEFQINNCEKVVDIQIEKLSFLEKTELAGECGLYYEKVEEEFDQQDIDIQYEYDFREHIVGKVWREAEKYYCSKEE